MPPTMLTRIKVEGLRGITEADIDGLAPITILVGANGSGKSTILEAIGVACASRDALSAFRALSHREWIGLKTFDYLFTGPQGEATISVWDGEQKLEVTTIGLSSISADLLAQARRADETNVRALTIDSDPRFQALIDSDGEVLSKFDHYVRRKFSLEASYTDRPAGAKRRFEKESFSSALREALRDIKLSPYYDDLIENLRIFRPDLVSIESIPVDERDEPHIFEKEPRVGYPLAFAGDGFQRLFRLAAAFARTKGGVVAIDEPEAFAHPRLYASLAKLLRRAADDGTQVFLATHSLEFIEAALVEYEETPETIAVVGLSNDRGQIDPVVISGPSAFRRVVELGDDLRL